MDPRRGLGVALALLFAGCASNGRDVVGPFSGPVKRFAVDAIAVPSQGSDPTDWADDLDGDGRGDDLVGAITVTLAGTMDLSLDAPSMIASGALASTVTIQGTSSAGVMFYGADADPATVAGGKFAADGSFLSNRTFDTSHPGAAVLRVPVFTNADPIALPLAGEEIDLDPDGNGGYSGFVRGGIATQDALDAAYVGVVQMMLDEPERHLPFAGLVDMNHDGVISHDEVDASVIGALLQPDIQLYQNGHYAPNPKKTLKDSVSIAVKFHVVPCDSGTCVSAGPPQACRDRVRDGSETDVDCGGSCHPCAAGAACSIGTDCQTGACDAGHCRAPSCSDGLRDGFETDVDCGDNCSPCALGKVCATNGDCMTGHCNNGIGALGTCVN